MMQIVWSNEDAVDPGHTENFVGVFDGFDVFGHDDDQDFVIGLCIISRRIGFEICGVKLSANGARTEWSITRRGDDSLSFGASIDHGHDNSPGANVEDALDIFS